MRYVTKFKIVCRSENYSRVRDVLRGYGLDTHWRDVIELSFEKSDSRRHEIEKELERVGYAPFVDYEPVFEPWEVEQAELLHLFVSALCGQSFAEWAKQLDLPPETPVIDMREMGKEDIAHTFAFDIVISERLKRILSEGGLSGWNVQPIQHRDPRKDQYPPLYHLTATNELPPLAPETELHEEKHTKPLEWPYGHPWQGQPDPLLGTTGLFQRGPLYYRRADLTRVEDFNRSHELFGEEPQKHSSLIISQRAWQVLSKHKIRKVDVEPVVILD